MSSLHIEVISPKGVLFKGDCHLAVVPGVNGELGIMFDHESVITALKEGKVQIFDEKENLIKSFDVGSGFAETSEAGKLTVLLDD